VTIVLWALLTSNTPATHPRISRAEKAYILDSLRGQTNDEKVGWCSVPWAKMMTSGAVWALIIANFTTDWGLYTYLTNIPTFYKEVLFFDIQSNGLYSALPFLGLWFTMSVVPIAADKLQAAKVMSTAATRKLFNSIGLLGPAMFLIGLSFVDCSQTGIAVALLVLAVTVAGFVYSGYFVNHMDIAPQYAGTLMGIANGLSASAGFLAPYVASVVTKPQTRESWQIVFFIAAAVYAVGAVAYLILAKGTIQPWAVIAKPDVMLEDMDHRGNETPDGDKIYKPSTNGHGGSNTNIQRSPPQYEA
jgi:ACS family sodium-dependent inorganic phosphate cotransporter-like MFS transporter 5